jgi:hypothetical protein
MCLHASCMVRRYAVLTIYRVANKVSPIAKVLALSVPLFYPEKDQWMNDVWVDISCDTSYQNS